jgi:hypothetical protein
VRPRRAAALASVVVIAGALTGVPLARAQGPAEPLGAAVGLVRANARVAHARFVGIATPLPDALAEAMDGTTWQPGCPVPLEDLRLLALSYWGFDGRPHIGPLVVNESAADDLLWVFRQLWDARFPIHAMRLARQFHPAQTDHDTPGDPTAAFNCRPVVTPNGPSHTISQHAYGLAVDINPIENPFVVDGFTRDSYARPYVDRSKDAPGMIHDGDVVVRSFEAIGWGWGGHWHDGQDYMHFSKTGT